MRSMILAVLSAVLLAASPAGAAEQKSPGYGSSVAVWGILGWNDSAGLGVSGQLALVPEGLIHDPGFKLHDSLDLDFGLDYLSAWHSYQSGPYTYDVSTVLLHAGVIWNFWLAPQLAVYPKLGLGYSFAHYSGAWDPAVGHVDYGGLYPELAAGVVYKLASGVALRGELGWAGLKLGVGFQF